MIICGVRSTDCHFLCLFSFFSVLHIWCSGYLGTIVKGTVHLKWKFCHLLTLMLFQKCMTYLSFLPLQNCFEPHWHLCMQKNRLFSKYLLFVFCKISHTCKRLVNYDRIFNIEWTIPLICAMNVWKVTHLVVTAPSLHLNLSPTSQDAPNPLLHSSNDIYILSWPFHLSFCAVTIFKYDFLWTTATILKVF